MSDTPSHAPVKSIMPKWVRGPQDFVGGVALIAIALFALWASSDLQGMRGFSFGAGTAPRMFAYLLLLHDPQPHKVLCVEEPENQLYPELMLMLAEEFQSYADRGGQVFISTHSPQFLNSIELESLFIIEKNEGVSQIFRAKEDPLVSELIRAGDRAGYLWNQGVFVGIKHRVQS